MVKIGIDIDGTAAEFLYVPLQKLYEKGYFLNLRPHNNLIKALEVLSQDPEVELYVVTSYLTDSNFAYIEKQLWCNRYLPFIDGKHRIFVPNGEDKAIYIKKSGIQMRDFTLLDDHTQNLLNIVAAGGRGIKFINTINNLGGNWKGDKLRFDREPIDMARKMKQLCKGDITLRDKSYVMAYTEKLFVECVALSAQIV